MTLFKPTKSYLLKGIPADVHQMAKEKAADHDPPLTMKWVLIDLLKKWVGRGPTDPEA